MTGHTVSASIKRGRVEAKKPDAQGEEPAFHVTNLRHGNWDCTCGKEGMTDAEAVEHLRDPEDDG